MTINSEGKEPKDPFADFDDIQRAIDAASGGSSDEDNEEAEKRLRESITAFDIPPPPKEKLGPRLENNPSLQNKHSSLFEIERVKNLQKILEEAKRKYEFINAPGRDKRRVEVEKVEARGNYMSALADFLYAKVKELETKVRIRRGGETNDAKEDKEMSYMSDPEYREGIDDIFTTHILSVQEEMQAIDEEFDASLAVVSEPFLLSLFGKRIYEHKAWPARRIFEAVTRPQIPGFEDIFSEEQRASFRLARRRYLESLVLGVKTGKETIKREYLSQRNALEKTLKLKRNNLRTERREEGENWLRKIKIEDSAFVAEVKNYWLTDERKSRVAPTKEKMKKKKGSVWRRVALAAGALLGLGVPSSIHRDTSEPIFESSVEEDVSGNVVIAARSDGAIETFESLLNTPDTIENQERATYVKEALGELMQGLGIDENATTEVQAYQLAERLGFVRERGDLLADADFTGKNTDPLIYEGGFFVFNPEIGTLIVRMPNGTEQLLVVNNLKVANYRE